MVQPYGVHAPGGMVGVARDGAELVHTASMLHRAYAFMGVVGVRVVALDHLLLYGRKGGARLPPAWFLMNVAGSEESTFSIELAGDVVSHIRLHAGLTIFRYATRHIK